MRQDALETDARARIFEGLNDEQADAVAATRGPLVILAGAGTGKTTTIVRRIANQIATEEFLAERILAVTFSVKAAREMGVRLAALGTPGVRAMTFHAEALAQFRRFSPDQPEILAHKGQVLHSIASRLPMPHKFTPLRDLAGEIEWAKNRRASARDYLETVAAARHEPPIPAELMHRVFIEYEKRKRKAGMLDFEDLLERTIGTLQDDARALGIVRERYASFTVDEYQDVNLLQQGLLDLWLGARDDVCVVGDDYQSIYGFTGASARHLLRFADRYEHATVVTLRDNYRSTPEVLSVANRLVPRLGGSRKELRAVMSAGQNPTLRDFERGIDEVDWIVGECIRLHGSGVPYEQMVVLFRINGRSEDFEEAFARARVPFQVRDGSFLARAAARSVAARAKRFSADLTVADPTVGDVVEQIARDLGFDPTAVYGSGEEATRQADLARLVALAREFPGTTLDDYLQDLRARFASEEEGRGVQLMTYHRAKGLEFDAVFLPRLEERELPFARATTDDEVAEERRLFYVGITRAKRFLAISFARSRDGERRTKPRPSLFLSEIRPSSDGAPSAPKARATPKHAVPVGDPVYDALKAWRLDVAKEAGLPAYVVFHDSTLAAIARATPATPAELRAIAGVGPLKAQRYGEAVLALINDARASVA